MQLEDPPPPEHAEADPQPHDHHPRPAIVEVNSQGVISIPPSSTYNLDIALPRNGYQFAELIIEGPHIMSGAGRSDKECCELVVMRASTKAVGHSVRDTAFKKVYNASYFKARGASYLSHKIFDSVTGIGNRRIALKDAVIMAPVADDVLRLTFENFFGGSSFLWVRGLAGMR